MNPISNSTGDVALRRARFGSTAPAVGKLTATATAAERVAVPPKSDTTGMFHSPYVQWKDLIEAKFRQLHQEWKAQTVALSSTHEIALTPAYQQIIGLGVEALPLILADLRATQDHWFWALKAISGDDPVSYDDRGDVDAMTSAWVRWGQAKGLLA